MKTLHLLLGGSERRLNSLIEATVLDVCYNRAAVKSTRVFRLGEFVRHGSCGSFDLLVLVANHLLPEPKQSEAGTDALIQAIWALKNVCRAPLVLIGSSPEMEYRFLEAGADVVLGHPLNTDELRVELDHLVPLPEAKEPVRRARWSLASLFGRQR